MRFTSPALIRFADQQQEAVRNNTDQRLMEVQTAVDDLSRSRGRFLGQRVLTGFGDYPKTAGTRLIFLMLQAGGGAGGSTGTGTGDGNGGGGNSGWLAAGWFEIPEASCPFSCGAPGVPGAPGNNPGGAGGDTFITINGVIRRARGGTGGGGSALLAQGAAGPAAPANQLLSGFSYISMGHGAWVQWTVAGVGFSGAGGSSSLGAGGRSTGPGISNGFAGTAGGGGSGARAQTGFTRVGGAGGAGLIIIYEFS